MKEPKFLLNAIVIGLAFASIISLTITHTEHYKAYLFLLVVALLLKLINIFR